MKFDPFYEVERLSFYIKRDGIDAAKTKAKELIKLYLDASLSTRVKFHSRTYPFRTSYLESAYSARYILRNKILDQISKELT